MRVVVNEMVYKPRVELARVLDVGIFAFDPNTLVGHDPMDLKTLRE